MAKKKLSEGEQASVDAAIELANKPIESAEPVQDILQEERIRKLESRVNLIAEIMRQQIGVTI